MVAEASVWVDLEIAVREWARDSVTSAARRVFFAANSDVTDPQIVVQRIAGPDDACFVQFDVWARKIEQAALVATELASALDQLSRYEYSGSIVLHGAVVTSVRRFHDPESNMPRYIVEAIITASSTVGPETSAS